MQAEMKMGIIRGVTLFLHITGALSIQKKLHNLPNQFELRRKTTNTLLSTGDICLIDEECADQNCAQVTNMTNDFGGLCTGTKFDGSSCTTNLECVSGNCAVSGICGKLNEGASCIEDNECYYGFCGGTGICGGLSVGTFCSEDNDCYSRICAAGICRDLEDGEACDIDENCESQECGGGICGKYVM